jgi:hypothetical protein
MAVSCLGLARNGFLPGASAAAGVPGQPGVEAQVLGLLNAERVRDGLAPLTADASMGALARAHSQDMASSDRLFHDLEQTGLLGRCSVIGENVGRAVSGDVVHQAFMGSPVHRADILGPYDRVGVGVVAGQAMLYVTEIFCRSSAPSAQSSPAPQPSPPAPTPKVTRPKPARPSPTPTPKAAPVVEPPVQSSGMGSPRQLL